MKKRLLHILSSIFHRPLPAIRLGKRVAIKTLTTYETGTIKTMCITGWTKDYYIVDGETFCLELGGCVYTATYTGNHINQTMTNVEASSLKIDPATITSLTYIE